MTVSLFWFRRDLRLNDNAALSASVSGSDTVHAVFCSSDLETLNERQRRFVAGALRSLRMTLEKADGSLAVLQGEAGAALEAEARRVGATKVYCARALDRSETIVEDQVRIRLRASGIELRTAGSAALHEPEVIADRKADAPVGYRVFPPFYAAWKSVAVERPLRPALPNGRALSPGAIPGAEVLSSSQDATEAAAQEALARFVSARSADYGANDEYPGRNATSGLATYLRFGLLSPRAIYRAIAEKMARTWTLAQERLSMEAFLRRLAWRDFYLHLAYHAPEIYDEALQEKMRGFEWSHDEHLLRAWMEGKTGYPLVDAAMRQLLSEGHVHQHAAVVAASFCAADLGLDWRLGRDVWMRQLLEADEALCVGNWQRIAGIGSDQASYPRIYNPIRQAELFDSQATYIRRWCRELAKLPTRAALAPWKISEAQQTELGFFTPENYPKPIVDHEAAGREFLRRYQTYRNRTVASAVKE